MMRYCLLILILAALPLHADPPPQVLGLTGTVSSVTVLPAAAPETAAIPDIDLTRMASWAMNYLARTPRKDLGYEPVFQCHPLQCPPTPAGHDSIVPCDTDARMDWEWYYMRDITGSTQAADVEEAFHQRLRNYIGPDGKVFSDPGAFNEALPNYKYRPEDRIIHIWGATKILMSLSLQYQRRHDEASKQLAHKVMLALKNLAVWNAAGDQCYFKCGMGALRPDGSPMPNGWNPQPAPIVEPLVTYYLATGDNEGLTFARAYAEGMIHHAQPDGIVFQPDGSVVGGPFGVGHSHATAHAVWGVAHLGVVTGDAKYSEFARKYFDWMLTRSTGTGWFPAGPDSCNETCCISDMISLATLIGRAGHPEYFDFADRYFRNYIANLQFIVTPEFEAYYRRLNKAKGDAAIEAGLVELRKFQGGVIGGSGLNDYENQLLGGVSGFEMFGCCAPEGMRAIHTVWAETIDRLPASPLGPAGVYVNLGNSRSSPHGQVVSTFDGNTARLTVHAAGKDAYFIRVPHWSPHEQVHAMANGKEIPIAWFGSYVRFDAHAGDELSVTYPIVRFDQEVSGIWKGAAPKLHITFHWQGNAVIATDPPARATPLYSGKPRQLPASP
jgi:hypothetical protein